MRWLLPTTLYTAKATALPSASMSPKSAGRPVTAVPRAEVKPVSTATPATTTAIPAHRRRVMRSEPVVHPISATKTGAV